MDQGLNLIVLFGCPVGLFFLVHFRSVRLVVVGFVVLFAVVVVAVASLVAVLVALVLVALGFFTQAGTNSTRSLSPPKLVLPTNATPVGRVR